MERVTGFPGSQVTAALRRITASGSIWSGPDPALSVGGKPESSMSVMDPYLTYFVKFPN